MIDGRGDNVLAHREVLLRISFVIADIVVECVYTKWWISLGVTVCWV